MVLGYFGKTPCEPDAEVIKIAEEQLGLQPTTETVVDLNDKDETKGLAVAQKDLKKQVLKLTMKTYSSPLLVKKKVSCSYKAKVQSVFVKRKQIRSSIILRTCRKWLHSYS